jgi:hypothetical protein
MATMLESNEPGRHCKKRKQITARDIEVALAKHFQYWRNIIVPNISNGLWIHECDLLVISEAGYMTEIEIKISVSDMKKDFEKLHQHRDRRNRIKQFYYAVPKSMILHKVIELIPEHAGILYVDFYQDVLRVYVHRNAKINNSVPLTKQEMSKAIWLGYLRIWPAKETVCKMQQKAFDLKNSTDERSMP